MNDTPIIQIGQTLLLSLQGELDDSTMLGIEARLTNEVARTHATGTLIDVSGLNTVDSFIARAIARMGAMVRLLGSEVAIVGIQPAVAITLVELGVSMGQLDTALDAEQGMALLERLRRDGHRA